MNHTKLPHHTRLPHHTQVSHYSNLSDSELYTLCKQFGRQALTARRKFAGTLPEVNRRHLYKRRGCTSIYEFAAKLAGMSRENVDKILRLSAKLADKPTLKQQLESGSQGWSKIEKVAYIATPETDKKWAEKVKTLPQNALELYVKGARHALTSQHFTKTESEGSFTLKSEMQPEKLQNPSTISFKVDSKLERKFRLFKHRLEKKRKQTLSFAEVLDVLLDDQDRESNTQAAAAGPAQAAQPIQSAQLNKNRPTGPTGPTGAKVQIQICKATSRHIPINVQRLVHAKHKGICAFPNCNKPATSLHHTQRFALEKSHAPEKIVPLCTAHERLAHSGLIANEDSSPETWGIQWARDIENEIATGHYKSFVDQMVWQYR